MFQDVNMEEVERACRDACWCIQDVDSDQPTMGEVVQILDGLRYVAVPPTPKILQAVAESSPAAACTHLSFFQANLTNLSTRYICSQTNERDGISYEEAYLLVHLEMT